MSGDVCSSELFTSCSEIPVSLFSNKCDNCGKSFVRRDDIQERNALHNHENAVENFGSPMELMLMKKMLELPRCRILLSVKPKVKFSVIVFYYGNQVTFVGGSKPAKLL